MSRLELGVRGRLLALQLVVFGALVLLTSPLTYLAMSRSLGHDRDAYLEAMASNLAAEVVASTVAPWEPASLPPRCLPQPVPTDSPEPGATHRPRHLLVWDGGSRALCSDGEELPLVPEAAHSALAEPRPRFADVRWRAEVLRVVEWPLRSPTGTRLVMEVGVSYTVAERALKHGLAFLLLLELAALVALVVGSWVLTREAFEPVDQIIRRVEQIDEANLAERLPTPPRPDQVGRLVAVVNRMLDRLARAFAAQSRFSSDVAHEIRSPLTAIRGQIEVALRRPRAAEEYRRVLEESLEEVLRLARLAEDLMSLSQGDAGVVEARRVTVDVRQLLLEAIARHRTRAAEKNIKITLEAPEKGSLVGDPSLLGQLVDNLLDNALIHTPNLGEVRVRAVRGADGVTIAVEDTGSGIPADHLPRIFERFYRVDPARSREMGGAGLGLAIVDQIARLHGGVVEVESTVGVGSVFRVHLPLAPPATGS